MRLVVSGIFAALAVAILASSGSLNAGGEKKPKHKIKEVMKGAHKSGLLKKVAKGEAGKDEAAKLVEFYLALSKNKSPAGEAKDWKKRTGALVRLAKAAADGKKVGRKLLKAASCKGCHSIHKK